jgi:hypothetical protein
MLLNPARHLHCWGYSVSSDPESLESQPVSRVAVSYSGYHTDQSGYLGMLWKPAKYMYKCTFILYMKITNHTKSICWTFWIKGSKYRNINDINEQYVEL